MAKEQLGVIQISKRIIRIGHQDYPLANISRVQTLRIRYGGRLATLAPLRGLIVVVLVALVLIAALAVLPTLDLNADFDVDTVATDIAGIISALAALRIIYLLLVLFYRLFIRKQRYALILETAGTQYTALSGTDPHEITRIKNVIVDAIENPPESVRNVSINGDVVVGNKAGRDQYLQGGSGNSMTIDR
ncbi:DUF6232 family protein [Kribbella sp. NPDC050459]|uniref:DUF6232 family protein n=1 Tax=Kribbella sp. NPDC050459 TaxID=3155785 RepID=UPI0033EF0E97